jgi:2-keto-4-pentenoate hydratase/2-oxohepta-3-ene-1,7-dioic acid hydratase in catechol pathway
MRLPTPITCKYASRWTASYVGTTTPMIWPTIPESIEFINSIEAIDIGDVLFMGTNHQGLGAMQDGDTIEIENEPIGRMSFGISDPLKRR